MIRPVLMRAMPVLVVACVLAGCDAHTRHDAPAITPQQLDAGAARFKVYCAPCHQPDGSGITGQIPPLAASPWVRGPESRTARIILNGLRGPIEVAGVTYNLEMPAIGQVMSDEDVALVLTYVRHQFAGLDRATPAEFVARVREQTRDRSDYWTAEELLAGP